MLVTLHVWRVPRRRIAAAMLQLARARRHQARFVKFLGTSNGFELKNADLTRYAAVTVSDRPVDYPAWNRLAVQRAVVELDPLHSRGSWSGRKPFEAGSKEAAARKPDGTVLAITRARLRPTRAFRFWQAIPPVIRELHTAPGLLAGFGIGEAPIGWQGTVSVWRDAADLTRFAYRQPEHRAVIARTAADRWYAEELFARFAVRGITGDRSVLGWLEEGQT
ncbi:monooxygenase [Actinoplanes sp. NPDC051513]|uniref:monooxygenase n=1 Tax=Actinoplanes sp. NPDC051513 TaxID=3363908 RepID=UPI0037B0E53C